MPQLKYKAGDVLMITGNKCAHDFRNGDIVVVLRRDDFSYRAHGERGQWYITDEEVEYIGEL